EERGDGFAVGRHGRESGLRHRAPDMLIGARLDPHGVGAAQEQRKGFSIRDHAAGGGDYGRLVLLDDALEAGALMATEGCEPSHLDEIGNGRAVVLLDPAIELDERTAERTGETAAQGRFTG